MTYLVAVAVVVTLAVLVVFAVNRLIDASTRPAKPGLALALPAEPGARCPKCGGPLAITLPGADDSARLVGRAQCGACDLRLTLAAT